MDTAIYTVEDQDRMTRAENYFSWQARLVRKHLGRRVLEVGCGTGNFTRLLLDRELVIAVDIEPRCIERLRERHGDRRNVVSLVASPGIPEFRDLAKFRPDCCVCLNVLEHIEDDRAALEAIAAVLIPGGRIVLILPAFQSLYGPIDRKLGHHRRYTRRAIRGLAEAVGLQVREAHYANLPGFFGWWTNAHVLRRDAQSERQIEVFDRYVVPLASAVESVARPPFGQSLVAVLGTRGRSPSSSRSTPNAARAGRCWRGCGARRCRTAARRKSWWWTTGPRTGPGGLFASRRMRES